MMVYACDVTVDDDNELVVMEPRITGGAEIAYVPISEADAERVIELRDTLAYHDLVARLLNESGVAVPRPIEHGEDPRRIRDSWTEWSELAAEIEDAIASAEDDRS